MENKQEFGPEKAYEIIRRMRDVAQWMSPETKIKYVINDKANAIEIHAVDFKFSTSYSIAAFESPTITMAITMEEIMRSFFKTVENYARILASAKKTCSKCSYGGCFSHCDCKLSPFYIEPERRETFDRPLDQDGTCQYWEPTDTAKQRIVDEASKQAETVVAFGKIPDGTSVKISKNGLYGKFDHPPIFDIGKSSSLRIAKLWKIAMRLHVGARILPAQVLEDPRFGAWSGSSKPKQHHYGKGGLAAHTLEVVELCMLALKHYGNEVDAKLLFLAALYHDAGKMDDYSPTDEGMSEWTSNDHKYRIHHVSKSAIMWVQAATAACMEQSEIDEVTHAILSHHGQREWGSPVRPATKLAWILHTCDMMSARVNDCDKQ